MESEKWLSKRMFTLLLMTVYAPLVKVFGHSYYADYQNIRFCSGEACREVSHLAVVAC